MTALLGALLLALQIVFTLLAFVGGLVWFLTLDLGDD